MKQSTDFLLLAEDPTAVLEQVAPDEVPADAPPASANYREADLNGVACAFCTKFRYTTSEQDEDGNIIPLGTCDLYEAKVRGDYVSDGYADSSPPMDSEGREVWDFSDNAKLMTEIHCAGGAATKSGSLVKKRILRTGTWDTMPTSNGKIKKRLRIVRDGKSDAKAGIVALSELKENFEAGAIQNVMIPLSEVPGDDHLTQQNMTKLNTGYVRSLEIEEENGVHYLTASMEFTEPEVAEKVMRGTYADVSAGIPFRVTRQGKEFGAALHHVCITNTPFIDGLGPFMAASDENPSQINVLHLTLSDESEVEEPAEPTEETDGALREEAEEEQVEAEAEEREEALSLTETLAAAQTALVDQHGLSDSYVAHDVRGDKIVVRNKIADKTWNVTYTVKDGKLTLAEFTEWEAVQQEEDAEAPEQVAVAASAAPLSSDNELAAAQAMRAFRAPQKTTTKKETDMALMTREELEALNLSDEQKAAFQTILDENAALSASTREAEADRRIDELKELGFSEKPGFLKLYRDVKLSDDGGPAVVLLSDNGSKERLTALEILDKAIDALSVEGKVLFSDQHLDPGHDDPKPKHGEEIPLEERIAAAKKLLGQD